MIINNHIYYFRDCFLNIFILNSYYIQTYTNLWNLHIYSCHRCNFILKYAPITTFAMPQVKLDYSNFTCGNAGVIQKPPESSSFWTAARGNLPRPSVGTFSLMIAILDTSIVPQTTNSKIWDTVMRCLLDDSFVDDFSSNKKDIF